MISETIRMNGLDGGGSDGGGWLGSWKMGSIGCVSLFC